MFSVLIYQIRGIIMKLSLRSARKLETNISKHLEENVFSTQAKVRVNTAKAELENTLSQARANVLESIADNLKLLDLKYTVRDLISAQNSAAGVDSLLTQKVAKEQKLSQLKSLVGAEPRLTSEELEDTLSLGKTRLSNPSTDVYGRSNDLVSVNLSVLSKEDVDGFKKQRATLVREVEKIEDKITELNHSVQIELSSDVVSLLQKHSLL
jgi:hypothetical protein